MKLEEEEEALYCKVNLSFYTLLSFLESGDVLCHILSVASILHGVHYIAFSTFFLFYVFYKYCPISLTLSSFPLTHGSKVDT